MVSKSTISPPVLAKALQKGLAYLSQAQRPSGEFATYVADRPNMVGARALPKSVYITTFVMHALRCLPSSPLIDQIEQRARDFLIREREDDGAWNYNGRGKGLIPADLDDTCCAVAALLQLGQRPDISFYALLWQNEDAPGGPYYTWLGINERANERLAAHGIFAREVDALVNANILFCAGLLDMPLPGATAYLKQVIYDQTYQSQSIYAISPHFPIYAISRAYKDGNVTALAPATTTMQHYILTKLSPPQAEPVAFNLACLTVSLLNLEAPLPVVEPYLTALYSTQQTDGRWPTWAAYTNCNGSPELTTALVLEALSKYLQRVNQSGL